MLIRAIPFPVATNLDVTPPRGFPTPRYVIPLAQTVLPSWMHRMMSLDSEDENRSQWLTGRDPMARHNHLLPIATTSYSPPATAVPYTITAQPL